MVEQQISNLHTRVRFPSPAPSRTRQSETKAKSDLASFLYREQKTLDVFMHYYVYILLSLKDKKFYTGFSTNLKERLSAHARGEVQSTKHRRPLKLVHYEYFINESDARAREVFLKSGFGRNQLKQSLKHTLE